MKALIDLKEGIKQGQQCKTLGSDRRRASHPKSRTLQLPPTLNPTLNPIEVPLRVQGKALPILNLLLLPAQKTADRRLTGPCQTPQKPTPSTSALWG